MDNTITSWMKQLSREDVNEEFSQLCHNYYKLAVMRVMQEMREKLKVPPEEIPTLLIAIFARFLNDAVYSVGAQIKSGINIYDIYNKEQLNLLLKVLNGEPLDPLSRSDIDADIQSGLAKYKDFIMKKASDFYL